MTALTTIAMTYKEGCRTVIKSQRSRRRLSWLAAPVILMMTMIQRVINQARGNLTMSEKGTTLRGLTTTTNKNKNSN